MHMPGSRTQGWAQESQPAVKGNKQRPLQIALCLPGGAPMLAAHRARPHPPPLYLEHPPRRQWRIEDFRIVPVRPLVGCIVFALSVADDVQHLLQWQARQRPRGGPHVPRQRHAKAEHSLHSSG